MPDAFKKLEDRHCDQPEVQTMRCAIDRRDGKQTLCLVRTDPPLPADVQLLASFDRTNLLRAADRVPGIERWIDEGVVPTRSIRSELDSKCSPGPDLLFVDAEGRDAVIPENTLTQGILPAVIYFEWINLSEEERAILITRFVDHHYGLLVAGGNVLAIRQEATT